MYRRSQRTRHRLARIAYRSEAAGGGARWLPRFPHDRLAAFEHALQGEALVPGDAGYDAARQVFYRQFEGTPEIVVYCESEVDVRRSLAFAAAERLRVVCRSGGHSSAGFSTCEGMILDLSRLNSVHIDAEARTASVQAGTSFRRLNAALADHGLHVPGGGCDDVCVGGYMQGGGYGFTSREFGMNCDCVTGVRVMLWDGRIVTANATRNADLFWAVRGGAGNFGVLLTICYALHPLGLLRGFGLSWDAAHAPAALVRLQSGWMRGGDPRLGYQCAVMVAEGAPRLYLRALFNGPDADFRAARDALAAIPGARPDIELSGSYAELNRELLEKPVPIPSVPDEVLEEKQSGYVARPVPEAQWRTVLDFMATSPNPWSNIGIEPYGGAIADAPDPGAFVHRAVDMNLFLEVFWLRPEEHAAAAAWLDAFMALMAPFLDGHAYQNYPRPGMKHAQEAYWGDALPRLRAVKAKYNPHDWFANAQQIRLADAEGPPDADAAAFAAGPILTD